MDIKVLVNFNKSEEINTVPLKDTGLEYLLTQLSCYSHYFYCVVLKCIKCNCRDTYCGAKRDLPSPGYSQLSKSTKITAKCQKQSPRFRCGLGVTTNFPGRDANPFKSTSTFVTCN